MKFSEGIRKVFLAGVGAVAITGEKAAEIVEELVKKGELTVEEGKVLNEDIRKKMKDKKPDFSAENIKKVVRDAVISVERMTQDERNTLRDQLDKADAAAKEAAAKFKDAVDEILDTKATDKTSAEEAAEAAEKEAEEVADAAELEAAEAVADAAGEIAEAAEEAVEEVVAEEVKDEEA